MSVTAILLLVISAGTHAGWNLIGKKTRSGPASFLLATGFGVLLLLPFLILFHEVISIFTPSVWLLVACTGAFQALYYSSLSAAYRKGDLSLIYPIARSTPAVLVAGFAFAVGRGDQVSILALLGIAFIFLGGYLLPMKHFKDFTLRKYLNAAFGLALLAAIGTAGYSIVDDTALRLLWSDQVHGIPSWHISLVFAFFEGMASAFWLSLYILINKRERRELASLTKPIGKGVTGAALMGVGIYLTYSLVLISMAFVKDVSYVVAFRQLSIPIGVVLGALVLHEKLYIPKISGALLMFAGLILVGLG
ncbi:MAG: multidrug DMT transporter permease [Spirochaetales bacterium]|jgi:drug/metabolite transporter (DMT)-like permease|nr:multidrug DMT transporter permease [Spirochaetales bacterium]